VFAAEDAIGDGTIYKAVTKQFLANMSVLAPFDSIQEAFDDIVRPMDAFVASLELESRKLAQLRDYLLPKLLSGAVRVREAERAVAEADDHGGVVAAGG
jgi:type I restriction enzyme S subunit